MPRFPHGGTVRLDVLQASLAVLAGSDPSLEPALAAIADPFFEAPADGRTARPRAAAKNLQDFGYMFPELQSIAANLLPDIPTTTDPTSGEVTPGTRDNLIALGETMVDPFNNGPEPNPGDSSIPAAYTYFGQLIDHDITLETFSADPADLFVPGLGPLDPSTIELLLKNLRTGTLDLDSVYGPPQQPDPTNANMLRIGTVAEVDPLSSFCAFVGCQRPAGKDDFNDVDRQPRHAIPSHDRAALIGDPRNDENLVVSQMHLAFLRTHNALVAQGMTFNQAQRALRRHYQWIVIHDYLKQRVADPAVVDDILLNGSPNFPLTVGPKAGEFFMPLEFAVAAFRFGHTMVRGAYNFNVNFNFSTGTPATLDLLFTFTALSGELGNFDTVPEHWIIEWERQVDQGSGSTFDRARRLDTKLVDPLFALKNFVGAPEPGNVAKLAVRNLVRGYLLRIPTGQAVATALGITPMTPAEIIAAAASPSQEQILTDAGFLERTPLWYYILAEASSGSANGGNGNRLGRVGSTIVATTLIEGVRRSKHSFLKLANWEPDLGPVPGTFTLPDLLRLGGVLA